MPLKALRHLMLAGGLTLLAVHPAQAQLPAFEAVRASHQPSDAILLDRYNQPLSDIRFNLEVRRFEWVPLAQFSPALREALIAAEDKRFFEHAGVDWKAFAGSAWHNLWSHTKRGGSTLTMQLAGLLEPALAMPNKGTQRRSVAQKWDQGFAAEELEQRWTKAQILEAYLNLAPFRGDLQGVHAASAVFFDKHPSQLDPAEAQLIAALLPSPNARAERIARRACARARVLKQTGLCPRIEALAPRLDTPRNKPRYALAPHLARLALHAGGDRVVTRLDQALQLAVLDELRSSLRNEPLLAYAGVIVLDNADASARAWVAGVDGQSVDALAANNLFSGAARPLAAALALERKQLTAASLLPAGPDPALDWQSLRQMLATPRPESDRALTDLVADALPERLAQHGLETDPEQALDAHATLPQLAQTLRALSLPQPFSPAQWQGAETPPRRLWRGETSFVLADLLGRATSHPELAGDEQEWAPTWGLASQKGNVAAVLQLSERYTVGVIVARPPQNSVPPAALAARLLRAIQQRIETAPPRPARQPAAVVSGIVAFEPAVEAARREWFLRGTEIVLSRPDAQFSGTTPSIAQPRGGWTEIELGAHEIMVLEAAGNAHAARWRVNGKDLGSGPRILWNPPAGHYLLELLGPAGEAWDQREFELQRRSVGAGSPGG